MIILKESTGDIKLCKFVGLHMDKIPGLEEKNYWPEISSYVFSDVYTENLITGECEDYIEHGQIYDYEIPIELRMNWDTLFTGGTWVKGNEIQMYVSGLPDGLRDDFENSTKSRFRGIQFDDIVYYDNF
jgi:hypothetical protein